jgi:hypothetical protein
MLSWQLERHCCATGRRKESWEEQDTELLSAYIPVDRRQTMGRGEDLPGWTRHSNAVYGALIAEVHRYGGSVIGSSSDAHDLGGVRCIYETACHCCLMSALGKVG